MTGIPASVAFLIGSRSASVFGTDVAIPSTFSVTAESISWACFCGSFADSLYFTVTPMSLPACSAPFFATAQNVSPSPWVITAIVRSRPWVSDTSSFLFDDPSTSVAPQGGEEGGQTEYEHGGQHVVQKSFHCFGIPPP